MFLSKITDVLKTSSQVQLLASSNSLSLNFKTSYSNFKVRGLRARLFLAFLLFHFSQRLWDFKFKGSMLFFEQKCKTGSKRENPPHTFRDTNFMFQLIYKNRELKIKLWWARAYGKNGCIHYNAYFVQRKLMHCWYFISIYRILNKLSEYIYSFI